MDRCDSSVSNNVSNNDGDTKSQKEHEMTWVTPPFCENKKLRIGFASTYFVFNPGNRWEEEVWKRKRRPFLKQRHAGMGVMFYFSSRPKGRDFLGASAELAG